MHFLKKLPCGAMLRRRFGGRRGGSGCEKIEKIENFRNFLDGSGGGLGVKIGTFGEV